MKRIFPILVALCLVIAMAIPAFASSVFNASSKSCVNLSDFAEGKVSVFVNWEIINGKTGNRIDITRYVDGSKDYSLYVMGYDSNNTYLFSIFYDDNGLTTSSLDFKLSDVSYDERILLSSIFDFAESLCNGSCPFTDTDGDSYCDVCGGFFTPPPPGPLVEVATKVDLWEVLTPILMILPIGLACLVGYKGLRKALALLQRILHQA